MNSFSFFQSYEIAVSGLSERKRGNFFVAIVDYVMNNIEPNFKDDILRRLFESQRHSMDTAKKRSLAGQTQSTSENQNKNKSKSTDNQNEIKRESNDEQYKGKYKEKENININEKEKIKKEKVFVSPSLDEVTVYIDTEDYNVDPQRFVAFYESKGWMVGKNKMRDWRAAVRNWHYSSAPPPAQKVSKEVRDALVGNKLA